VDIGYVVQYPRFMDIEALQNKVKAKSRSLSGFSLVATNGRVQVGKAASLLADRLNMIGSYL